MGRSSRIAAAVGALPFFMESEIDVSKRSKTVLKSMVHVFDESVAASISNDQTLAEESDSRLR